MYLVSVVVTGMGITALTVLRRFEDKNDHLFTRRVSLVLADAGVLGLVLSALRERGVVASDFDYERRLDEEKQRTTVTFEVEVPVAVGVTQVIACIEAVQGVRRVQVERRQ